MEHHLGIISIPLALILVFTLHLKIYGVYIAIATGNLCAVPISIFWMKLHLNRIMTKN
jgi:Na+-driven multidrug efflux pump